MTVLADFAQFCTDVEASAVYGKWASQNPAEATKWKAFEAAVKNWLANTVATPPTVPTLSTSFGKALADAGVETIHFGQAVGTVTPPTTATFDTVTAYLDDPLPDLTNAVVCSTAAEFATACKNAAAGQVIHVLGGVVVPGEFTGFNRMITGGTVSVVFDPGAGFSGTPGQNLPAVWLRYCGGWRVWGGSLTTGPAGGYGILAYTMPGPFKWTGFKVSNCGNTGVAVYPADGPIAGLILKGLVSMCGLDLSYDPHAEKGTGIHAWNLADASGGQVHDSTFACDVQDQPTGAACEIDLNETGPNVKVFIRAKHLGFALSGTTWTGDAQSQVAGNVAQLWGSSFPGSLDLAYLEGNDIQGRIVECSGVSSGVSLANGKVEYGCATGPILQNPLLPKVAYNVKGGLVLGNCTPLP